MMSYAERHVLCCKMNRGLRRLLSDKTWDDARYAAGDSDSWIKLAHVSMTLDGCLYNRPTRPDELAWREECRRAVQFSGQLMHEIHVDHPEVHGFTFGTHPQGVTQNVFAVCQIAALELSKEIARIEEQHPELASFFDAERAAYAQTSQDGFWGQ